MSEDDQDRLSARLTVDYLTAVKIRDSALGYALALEHAMPPALRQRSDDLSPGDEITEHDIAMLAGRDRMAEQAVADRVLRHAHLFAEFIRSGFDGELELDGLTTLDGDRPAEGDRQGGG